MSTYTRSGHIHGHYNAGRGGKYDGKGRQHAREFLGQLGYSVEDYDKDATGKTIYTNPDLKATKQQEDGTEKVVLVEAAVKRASLWKYVKDGVDVESRKLKYISGQTTYIAMSDDDGENMLLIPMEWLQQAQQSCGDEFYGQKTPGSENFQMPEHGCHRVRKLISQGYNQSGSVEDFYRIPYNKCKHFRKVDGVYKPVGGSNG